MVGEPVQQCAGQTFRAEYPGPFVERQVGGHQSGAALVTLAEHLEQQFGAGFTERNKAGSMTSRLYLANCFWKRSRRFSSLASSSS